jgi:hypothetical protein
VIEHTSTENQVGKISTHSCSWRRKNDWQERNRVNRKKSEPATKTLLRLNRNGENGEAKIQLLRQGPKPLLSDPNQERNQHNTHMNKFFVENQQEYNRSAKVSALPPSFD